MKTDLVKTHAADIANWLVGRVDYLETEIAYAKECDAYAVELERHIVEDLISGLCSLMLMLRRTGES